MGIFDTLLGKDAEEAARNAAADTYGKQTQAAGSIRQGGQDYQGNMLDLSRLFQPYSQAGNSALERLLAGLGLGGDTAGFTNAYRSLPGYQAGMDTGSKAVTARLNAGPGMQSGAAMKALQRFGSDYEDQRSGDYLSRLFGLVGTGQNATGQQVATAGQGYGGALNANTRANELLYGGAGTIGQGDVAGANARAQGLGNTINLGLQAGGMALGALGGMGGMGGGFGSSFGGGMANGFGQANPWSSAGNKFMWTA